MRIRIKVYDTDGAVYNRLDLSVTNEDTIPDTLQDIGEFLSEQYLELIDGGTEE